MPVGVSIIVLGELEWGAWLSNRQDQSFASITDFIAAVQVVDLDADVAREYGQLRAHLRSIGQPIGPNDLWIAAHALARGVPLDHAQSLRIPARAGPHRRDLDDGSGLRACTPAGGHVGEPYARHLASTAARGRSQPLAGETRPSRAAIASSSRPPSGSARAASRSARRLPAGSEAAVQAARQAIVRSKFRTPRSWVSP